MGGQNICRNGKIEARFLHYGSWNYWKRGSTCPRKSPERSMWSLSVLIDENISAAPGRTAQTQLSLLPRSSPPPVLITQLC